MLQENNMKKVQFGAGSLHIEGFENYDSEAQADITKPLNFESDSVDLIYAEMVVEHITHKEAWQFFEECHRILLPGGLMRVVVPDFVRVWKLKNPEWLRVNRDVTNNNGTLKDQMKSIIYGHGHQAAWSSELLKSFLEAVEFRNVEVCEAMQSSRPELRNMEQHYRSVGIEVAWSESGCVDAEK
jgi:predicted SAM-dependent methyltransferase